MTVMLCLHLSLKLVISVIKEKSYVFVIAKNNFVII